MTAALIVYESLFGNAHAIADAIAEGANSGGDVRVMDVRSAPGIIGEPVDLLIVGGPTHQLGLSRPASRRQAAGQYPEAPDAAEVGLREWLTSLVVPPDTAGAAFDTRLRRPTMLRWLDHASGTAQRLLRRRGLRIIGPPQAFLVESATGPLVAGELERARAWGEFLTAHGGQPSE